MKKYILCLSFIGMLWGCESGSNSRIEGTVTDATDSTLYLEISRLNGISILDSVKLKSNGKFAFKVPQNESPEFYQLRLGKAVINFALDSIETVEILASKNNFPTGYTIESSESNKNIQKVALLSSNLRQALTSLNQQFTEKKITVDDYKKNAIDLINKYKNEAKAIIYSDIKAPSSYFTLFQTIDNLPILDIYDKEEYKLFAGVATAYQQFYPNWDRSVNLYNNGLQALKALRGEAVATFPKEEVKSIGYFDIELPNVRDRICKLSDLIKQQKVILLDFTSYILERSPQYNMLLADLYKKYAAQGFEIYQVGLDPDENTWKTSADNLPWITVRDPKHIESDYAKQYNIQQIPTAFLINRSGEVVKRSTDILNLENEIKKLL